MIGQGTQASNPHLFHKEVIDAGDGTILLTRVLARSVSSILVSVYQGGVNIWFGQMGSGLSCVPDLHFGTVQRPVYCPIPPGNYTFTIQAVGTTLATVFFGGE